MSRRNRTNGKHALVIEVDGPWFAMPAGFYSSRLYAELSLHAKAMFSMFLGQLGTKHYNNGRLGAPEKTLAANGWASQASAYAAIRELEDAGLLVRTRQGYRGCMALYGITLFPMHCQKKDDLDAGAGEWSVTDWRKSGKAGPPTAENPAIWSRPRSKPRGGVAECIPTTGKHQGAAGAECAPAAGEHQGAENCDRHSPGGRALPHCAPAAGEHCAENPQCSPARGAHQGGLGPNALPPGEQLSKEAICRRASGGVSAADADPAGAPPEPSGLVLDAGPVDQSESAAVIELSAAIHPGRGSTLTASPSVHEGPEPVLPPMPAKDDPDRPAKLLVWKDEQIEAEDAQRLWRKRRGARLVAEARQKTAPTSPTSA